MPKIKERTQAYDIDTLYVGYDFSSSLEDSVPNFSNDFIEGNLDTEVDGQTYKKVIAVDGSSQVTEDSLADSAVTSGKINVSILSAITADCGTLTAGTITGATMQTSASANTGVKMSSGIGGIDVYGQSLEFHTTGGTLRGRVYADTGVPMQIVGLGDAVILGTSPSSHDVIVSADRFIPSSDNATDLGRSNVQWKDLYIDGTANIDSLVADTADINAGTIDGTVIGGTTPATIDTTILNSTNEIWFTNYLSNQGESFTADNNGNVTIEGTASIDTLRVNQTPTATPPTPSHYITINCNGTLYRMCLDQN